MSDLSKPKLFHVSETPNIRLFEPRPDKRGELAVWAVGEPKLHNYLLPRDCPRITVFADDKTSDEDRSRFLESAESVVAIESGWFNAFSKPHSTFTSSTLSRFCWLIRQRVITSPKKRLVPPVKRPSQTSWVRCLKKA